MPAKVICVVGPTASGKTALGVWLAQNYNGEVVSCDSMQVYRRMDIGTAKPTKWEMDGVTHHMIDVVNPEEDYSVERYRRDAGVCVDDILSRGRLPIIVGGSGLYLDGLLSGQDYAARSIRRREELFAQYRAEGIEPLWEKLEQVDPKSASGLSPNDVKRVIRALEVWYETGETLSDHNAATSLRPARYTALKLGLNFENRTDLYTRIDVRVDHMIRCGLLEEVRTLLASGVSPVCTAMQAIGYKELIPVVTGEKKAEDAFAAIKLHSHQYAKRQISWFRRDKDIVWYFLGSVLDEGSLHKFVERRMKEAGM